jgi:hypothetical protein
VLGKGEHWNLLLVDVTRWFRLTITATKPSRSCAECRSVRQFFFRKGIFGLGGWIVLQPPSLSIYTSAMELTAPPRPMTKVSFAGKENSVRCVRVQRVLLHMRKPRRFKRVNVKYQSHDGLPIASDGAIQSSSQHYVAKPQTNLSLSSYYHAQAHS